LYQNKANFLKRAILKKNFLKKKKVILEPALEKQLGEVLTNHI